jgi:hypothetical protein
VTLNTARPATSDASSKSHDPQFNADISAELAQTCEELRRFVAERDGQPLEAIPAERS